MVSIHYDEAIPSTHDLLHTQKKLKRHEFCENLIHSICKRLFFSPLTERSKMKKTNYLLCISGLGTGQKPPVISFPTRTLVCSKHLAEVAMDGVCQNEMYTTSVMDRRIASYVVVSMQERHLVDTPDSLFA